MARQLPTLFLLGYEKGWNDDYLYNHDHGKHLAKQIDSKYNSLRDNHQIYCKMYFVSTVCPGVTNGLCDTCYRRKRFDEYFKQNPGGFRSG